MWRRWSGGLLRRYGLELGTSGVVTDHFVCEIEVLGNHVINTK